MKLLHDNRGLSLIELIVTMVILGILASAILPSAHMAGKRRKEVELRRNLRTIRMAIDEFKKNSDKVPMPPTKNGYPETLDQLVEGVEFGSGAKTEKKKFLRRIPRDPFMPDEGEPGSYGWGLRSFTDKPDSTIWGGEDVYDVYSRSEETAIDGKSKYNEW